MTAFIRIEDRIYQPGTVLRGTATLEPRAGHEQMRVELTVLWETEGKGDTDRGVILDRVLCEGNAEAGRGHYPFEVTLPFFPLSYEGTLIKIGWRVRVRRLMPLAADDIIDQPFWAAWPTE